VISDIESAAQAILSTGRIVETETLTLDDGVVDAGESHALINGDVTVGAGLKGAKSLVVQGALLGEADRLCQIEMGEDAVVLGSARYAHVVARSILIGRETRDCRLTAQADIRIGGDLADSRIVVGEFSGEKQGIEELKQRIRQLEHDRRSVEQQLRIDEKRMGRQLQTASFGLDVSAGHLVRQSDNLVQIDLQSLYKIIGEKSEQDVDRALLEFFSKAVVGVLVRNNRHHIVNNPNRQRIFFGTVKSLRNLFLLTHRRDRQSDLISKAEARLDRLIDALNTQVCAVHVRGEMLPEVHMRFLLPDVARFQDGEVSVGMQTAELTVRPGADANHREIIQVDISGQETVQNVEAKTLQRISIRVHEGRVAWGPAGAFAEDKG